MGKSGTGSSSSSSSSGYALGPPWLFRGRALYQLHLVKAEIARAFIPKELKLVEVFGYTLGGLFLAHYDDSPAGAFDELVVIAGIVWNPPTSCAWASRVLVNSQEACWHGRKEIGLPSHVAIFSKRDRETSGNPLQMSFMSSTHSKLKKYSEIQVLEKEGTSEVSICNICLPIAGETWLGPKIRMSLPSFSGQTVHNPHLLKYSCQLECRVRTVKTAKISRPMTIQLDNIYEDIEVKGSKFGDKSPNEDGERSRNIAVLLSKPLIALEFNLLKMQVEAPKIVNAQSMSKKNQVGGLTT